jgi:glycosyltransferase involved in cell wall biosynthesis
MLSVVMPVHNARPFLTQSIESILNQTFQDYEFIILNDGSTDGSGDLIREWALKDSRIKYFESQECLGLSRSSNLSVSKSSSPIVARMDADDISHKNRLQQQWHVIQNEPSIAAVGTLCVGIDATGKEVRPSDRWRILRRSDYVPFPHGSAMFRKDVFESIGGYSSCHVSGEDQDLFMRMARKARVVTLPDVLYSYRYHTHNATLSNGVTLIRQGHRHNGNELAAFYMLGAMRLWAGHKPLILEELLSKPSLKWNYQTLVTLVSAGWGNVHPGSLRTVLRLLIRFRDSIAGMQIKEGRPYEWRLRQQSPASESVAVIGFES